MGAKESGGLEPLRSAIEAASAVDLPDEELRPAVQLLEELEAARQPLTFADVPRPEMEALEAVVSREAAEAILNRCLGISSGGGFQESILVEFHYNNFAFCQRSKFSAEKASTLISIFKVVHTKAIAEVSTSPLSEADARALFFALVDRHSQQLPPYRVGVFSRDDAAAVKAYADRSFFRYYKMYTFAYWQHQELSVRSAFERVAPPVQPAVSLKQWHEVDPRTVPELQDVFVNPEAAASTASAAAATTDAPALDQHRAASPFADEREAGVSAAIDEVLQGHLSNLEPRLGTHPLTK